MSSPVIKSMQTASDRGQLQIQIVSQIQNRPIRGAKISISYTGAPGQPLEQVQTNSSGQTEMLELAAPPVEYSLQPSVEQPYSEYNLNVEAEGYEPVEVSGSEILSGEISRQKIELRPLSDGAYEDVVIPDHTLFGDYPEKIPEEEVKPVNESGEIVLSRVVIPEYVVVHDGSPSDSTANNYYVRYRDYIKNVACGSPVNVTKSFNTSPPPMTIRLPMRFTTLWQIPSRMLVWRRFTIISVCLRKKASSPN